MARNNRHNAAFVVGAVLGGLIGSAAALWRTPYSGEELRAKLAGGEPSYGSTSIQASTGEGRSLKDKALSTVEHTLAPIVGVELGKTANNSGPLTDRTVPRESLSTMGPGTGTRPATGIGVGDSTGEPPARPDEDPLGYEDDRNRGGRANVTPVDEDGGAPSRMSSPTEPVPDHTAATVDELTTPQTHLVPDAFQQEKGEMRPFPKLGGNEPQDR